MTYRAAAVVAAIAMAALLSGCAAPRMPQPPTTAEVDAYIATQNSAWWHSMFPNEPQPAVKTYRTASSSEQKIAVNGCLAAQGLQLTEEPSKNPTPDYPAYERAVWICYQRFALPADVVIAEGYESRDQLAYLYDYYVDRLVPCLDLLGYDVGRVPDRGAFLDLSDGYPAWNPYGVIGLAPTTLGGWAGVIARCPPPPFARILAPAAGSPFGGSGS